MARQASAGELRTRIYVFDRPLDGHGEERLDGSGYPHGLRGEQIPVEVRIVTILDIFDALTADDRPYKPGMPVPKASKISRIVIMRTS